LLKMAPKSLSRKHLLEALRMRGIDHTEEPPRNLQPKWLPYVGDPRWLKIDRWLDQANLLRPKETWIKQPSEETLSRLPLTNFEIRNYRLVSPEELFPLLQKVRQTLNWVTSQPRPAGIDHFELDPFVLFLAALGTEDLTHVHACPICGKFFRARRKDQLACSSKCANVERQRRFRKNSPTYERNQKRNRAAQQARAYREKEALSANLSKLRSR
jgi:hypothetical protein